MEDDDEVPCREQDRLVIVTDYNETQILFLHPDTLDFLSKWPDPGKMYHRRILKVRKVDEDHFLVTESGSGGVSDAGAGVAVFRIDRPKRGRPCVSSTEVKQMQEIHRSSICAVDVVPSSHGCPFARIIAMDNTGKGWKDGGAPKLVVWHSETGELLKTFEAPPTDGKAVRLCSLKPSCFFACGSGDLASRWTDAPGLVQKHDLERSRPFSVAELLSGKSPSNALDVNSESGVVLAGGYSSELWDNDLQECVGSWTEEKRRGVCVAKFVPDKHLIVVGLTTGALSSRDIRKLDERLHHIPMKGNYTTVQDIARVGPTDFVTVSYGKNSVMRRSLADSSSLSLKNPSNSWMYGVCTIGTEYDSPGSSPVDHDAELTERIGFLIETLVDGFPRRCDVAGVLLQYPAWIS